MEVEPRRPSRFLFLPLPHPHAIPTTPLQPTARRPPTWTWILWRGYHCLALPFLRWQVGPTLMGPTCQWQNGRIVRAPHPSRPHRSSAFVCMTCGPAELRRPSTFYHRHTRLDAVCLLRCCALIRTPAPSNFHPVAVTHFVPGINPQLEYLCTTGSTVTSQIFNLECYT